MQNDGRVRLSRRQVLELGATGLVASSLALVDALTSPLTRVAKAAPSDLPATQFDIADYVAPAESIDGTLFQFGPVFTLFVTTRLTRKPDAADQRMLADALANIEERYAFTPSGVFSHIGYGLPYFNRLPGGLTGDLLAGHMPRLLLDRRRYALEEAVPAPTDVAPQNPDASKSTYNLSTTIEANDLLFTFRSDVRENLTDVLAWLLGSNELNGAGVQSPSFAGLNEVTSTRLMFVQRGLPRRIAESEGLPYASRIHPDSPMWMSFASQQADSSGPAAITTFDGNRSAQFTSAAAGDYFAGGAIQHLSHVILDLGQWYADAEPYLERVQHMFRSNPPPSTGNDDQFTDGGGPAFLPNSFQGRDDARQNAVGQGTLNGLQRIGHTTALQRASRAADGTPIHLRIDGPGYDNLDVPDGTKQPKLHFSMFIPTAEVFERMRRYQAGTDLVSAYGVGPQANGIERFTTTTRRQNFLVPPRAHRSFPLLELT
jgi:hypothetical protein